ncbi:MAG: hypothetical protein V7707_15395 [Motiliproteus sp.]
MTQSTAIKPATALSGKIKLSVASLLLTVTCSTLATAEPMALRCSYTQASFNASYMTQPESRVCPQDRCYYDLRFDTDSGSAAVNAATDYSLTVSDSHFQLDRQKRNIVVGGIDEDQFMINRQDLSYSSRKSTPPGVTLETVGQCQPL